MLQNDLLQMCTFAAVQTFLVVVEKLSLLLIRKKYNLKKDVNIFANKAENVHVCRKSDESCKKDGKIFMCPVVYIYLIIAYKPNMKSLIFC